MSRRRLGLIVAVGVVSVSGVATSQPRELLALKGQPVQPVIDKLGVPESQVPAANGGATYVWTVRSMVNMPTRVTRTDYATGIATTYEAMEMRPQLTPCTVRLVTDSAGTITDVEPKGDFAACSAVVDRLQGKG